MLRKIVKESYTARALLLLLVLLLISLYLSSGYLARYVTSANNSASSRTAKFSFNINNNSSLELDLSAVNAPGTSHSYSFDVVSSSTNEVARGYLVKVKTTNNLPLNITLADDSSTLASTTATKGTGISYELTTSGTVAAGTALSKRYTITVSWPANETSSDYAGVIGVISLEVSGTQID